MFQPLEIAIEVFTSDSHRSRDSEVGLGFKPATKSLGKVSHLRRVAQRLVSFVEVSVSILQPFELCFLGTQLGGSIRPSVLDG